VEGLFTRRRTLPQPLGSMQPPGRGIGPDRAVGESYSPHIVAVPPGRSHPPLGYHQHVPDEHRPVHFIPPSSPSNAPVGIDVPLVEHMLPGVGGAEGDSLGGNDSFRGATSQIDRVDSESDVLGKCFETILHGYAYHDLRAFPGLSLIALPCSVSGTQNDPSGRRNQWKRGERSLTVVPSPA
jgi:hypothetical protein